LPWSNFTVSDLTLRNLIHFELMLVQGEGLGSSFSLLQVFPAPFVEEATFPPMHLLGFFVKNQMAVVV
jgi:hypothetical protein